MACPGCSCGQAQLELARTVNKIALKQKDPSKLMEGSNTVVYLDGQPLKNVQRVEVIVSANGMGMVRIEMGALIEMDEAVVKDAEVEVSDEKGS